MLIPFQSLHKRHTLLIQTYCTLKSKKHQGSIFLYKIGQLHLVIVLRRMAISSLEGAIPGVENMRLTASKSLESEREI